MSYTSTIARLADATPADRNRAVDALRAASILVVVFGHWLMAAVVVRDGALTAGHLLDEARWTHPLTWVLQVMPVFFVVGGFSNGVSWRSARARGDAYGGWLRARLRRLVLPVVPLIGVWAVGAWVALEAGLDPQMVRLASQVALVPTWFLAAYVVIVTLTPVGLALWERFGWWSVAAGIVVAGGIDAVTIGLGADAVGYLNYVAVWGTVHQLGFAWLDGRLGRPVVRLAGGAVALALLVAVVWIGPYPVAMVGLDAAEVTNSSPPKVTLILLGVFQAGLLLAAEAPLRRFLQRQRPWRAVVAVSAQIMTLYLWHLTAMVLVIGASLLAGGWGLGAEPVSGGWWLSRVAWFAAVAVPTALLVAAFGRFERPRPDLRPAPAWWRPLLAVVGVCAGLGLLAAVGIADDAGINGLILALPLLGVVAGGIGGARFHHPADPTP